MGMIKCRGTKLRRENWSDVNKRYKLWEKSYTSIPTDLLEKLHAVASIVVRMAPCKEATPHHEPQGQGQRKQRKRVKKTLNRENSRKERVTESDPTRRPAFGKLVWEGCCSWQVCLWPVTLSQVILMSFKYTSVAVYCMNQWVLPQLLVIWDGNKSKYMVWSFRTGIHNQSNQVLMCDRCVLWPSPSYLNFVMQTHFNIPVWISPALLKMNTTFFAWILINVEYKPCYTLLSLKQW